MVNLEWLHKWIWCLGAMLYITLAQAQDVVVKSGTEQVMFQNEMYRSAIADMETFSTATINKLKFEKNNLPNVNNGEKVLLAQFRLQNKTGEQLFLEVAYPAIRQLQLFHKNKSTGQYDEVANTGYNNSFYDKLFGSRNFVLPLGNDLESEVNEYVLAANSEAPVFLPMAIRNLASVQRDLIFSSLVYGAYLGVFLALLLYNLFILFATGDRSYIPYLFFLVFIVLAQSAMSGYGYKYFWPRLSEFNRYAIPLFSALAGIAGLVFARMFLRINHFFRSRVLGISFYVLEILYGLSAILAFAGMFRFSYSMLNVLAIIGALFLMGVALRVARKGYTPAIFYFVAWSIFLISLFILALRNLSIVPFNDFTNNVVFIGAAGEVILLSLALANKINVMRRQSQESQALALKVSQENEMIIRDQNVVLENKVHERTSELQEANEELTVTLANLRDTQTQLVDAEKMASLGQLTAGIAHEINNPINFVTSNITPLKRDIEEMYELIDAYATVTEDALEKLKEAHELKEELDYEYLKEEIDSLVNGISDGASRTSDIVRGLRTFSRLDEDVIKQADIHEGLASTLVILTSKFKEGIEVVKDFDLQLPLVECYPGKLNQVFMNILNNAIYAVTHKVYSDPEKPTITIQTIKQENTIAIHLRDNGIGMDEQTKKKMFDPFFTTKDVGEGTGLGMAIVYKIIEKHRGSLVVNSELGAGTEFIITLPMRQPNEF